MSQPLGFVDSNLPSHVCRLQKVIYGLKQAPRAWYKELSSFLISHSFVNFKSNASLFIYNHHNKIIYFLVYVDDLLVTSNNALLVSQINGVLSSQFSIKDLGSLHYFLGVEVITRGVARFQNLGKLIFLYVTNQEPNSDSI